MKKKSVLSLNVLFWEGCLPSSRIVRIGMLNGTGIMTCVFSNIDSVVV